MKKHNFFIEKQNFISALDKACDDDELRPLLCCVYFKNDYAYATNAHVLIKQSLEHSNVIDKENLNGKFIHKDVFKKIRMYKFAKATETGVECGDEQYNLYVTFKYYDPDGKKYPNCDAVLNSFKNETITEIGFSSKEMKILFESMYVDRGKLKFVFGNNHKATQVTSPGIDNQVAIIMPVMLNDYE